MNQAGPWLALAFGVAVVLPAPRPARAEDAPPAAIRPLGIRYHLERIEVLGNRHTVTDVILDRVPFRAGQTLDVDDPEIEASRLRLLATGYFSEADLSLRRGRQRGWVVLVVRVRERGTLRIQDLTLGAAQGTAYGGLELGDENFLGLGVQTALAFVLGDRQLGTRLRLTDPGLFGPRTYAQAVVLFNRARVLRGTGEVTSTGCPATGEYRCDYSTVEYQRGGLRLGLGREVADALRLHVRYRLEVVDATQLPRAASHERGSETAPIHHDLLPGTSFLSTVAAGIERDTRDDPYLPGRGVRLFAEAELGTRVIGSSYTYARFLGELEGYVPLRWGHVLRLDVLGGLVLGRAPFFEQFFVGDLSDLLPSRVLELDFDDRDAPNLLGTAIADMRYENLAGRLGLEYVIPLHRARQLVYGVDFFAGAGVYALTPLQGLELAPSGYDGIARVPIDLTFNLGFRVDTEVGIFGLSFSNLIGLIPFRREEP